MEVVQILGMSKCVSLPEKFANNFQVRQHSGVVFMYVPNDATNSLIIQKWTVAS